MRDLAQVTDLDVSFNRCDGSRMLSRALDFSPRLRHLTLAGLEGTQISLISPTLEMLDMRETGKGATLVHVECPQLRSIRQRYEPYGNGIRLFDPDTELYLPMWEDLDDWLTAREALTV